MALIIPTRNRADDLRRCLESLDGETLTPDVVVVADCSDDGSASDVADEWSRRSASEVIFLSCPLRGLTAQRNFGLAHVPDGIDYIAFSDDDIVFASDYHERLVNLIEQQAAEGVIAVAGATAREPDPSDDSHVRHWLRRLFLLEAAVQRGQVLTSGVNVRPPDSGGPVEVGWLFGCGLYSAELALATPFAEELPGYATYEDVDYSLCIGRSGRLLVDPEARVVHAHSAVGRPSDRDLMRMAVRNRHWLVARHRQSGLSLVAFWWSILGQAAMLTVSAGLRRRTGAREVLPGLLAGVRDILGEWRARR